MKRKEFIDGRKKRDPLVSEKKDYRTAGPVTSVGGDPLRSSIADWRRRDRKTILALPK